VHIFEDFYCQLLLSVHFDGISDRPDSLPTVSEHTEGKQIRTVK